jgi:hypothetical protein
MFPVILFMAQVKRRKTARASRGASGSKRVSVRGAPKSADTRHLSQPAGTGTRKRKVKRKPSDDEFITRTTERKKDTEDDMSEDSFMVEPKKSTREKRHDTPEVHRVSSKPEFGESLKVGFSAKNSRKNSKWENKTSSNGEGDSAVKDEGLNQDEQVTISDVDDDTYIEWSPNNDEAERPEGEYEKDFNMEELKCRNCDDIINMKFIKYYTRNMGSEHIRVKGPFCSKLCSMEYTEA